MQARVASRTRDRDLLWVTLFLIIFLNGFESGGYQASLASIGQSFDLTITSMGIYAAIELLADMLAPILLGSWADRVGKGLSLTVMLALQLVATGVVWLAPSGTAFVAGIFLLGLTTSALQFIAIALLADAYPLSGKRKVGFVTSMYAFGALTSPLVVSLLFGCGLTWRALFVILAAGTALSLAAIRFAGTKEREQRPANATRRSTGSFVLPAILLLCVVMCVYVGFENGFAFFVDTLFTNVLHASTGKLALSLYWAVMIPARLLVGFFSDHAKKILYGSLIAIPLVATVVAFASSAPLVLALCVPLGLASGAVYPSVLTIALPFAGRRTATATGMITAATGIGGFALTALTGLLADSWGMGAALVTLSAFFVFALAAVFALRRFETERA